MCYRYRKRFHKFDKESKGFITTVDVQQVLEVSRRSPRRYFIFIYTLVIVTRYRSLVLFFSLLCRASMSPLMRMRSMKSLMRWTSTRTDKWSLMSSCRYVTCERKHLITHHLLQQMFHVLLQRCRHDS